ncbi:MAG TPA: hypothetical protein VFR63_04510 [Gaiellaceae bacterium]|nr:hypothetical protein [Gaiellaceae bacterium]
MLRTDGPNRDDSDPPLRGLYNLTVEETVIEDAYWDAVAMFGRMCPCARGACGQVHARVYCRDSCRVVAWQRRQWT